MILDLWLCPPLAFARVGSSSTPSPNYGWGNGPQGGTRLVPAPTLAMDKRNGSLSMSMPEEPLVLKDEEGYRPVCPFFELYGRWEADGQKQEGPITEEVLAQFDLVAADVQWSVHVANRKAQHFSRSEGDVVEARLALKGDTEQHVLHGTSPQGHGEPLVSAKDAMVMGWVQVARPSAEFPGLRLRFTPPPGAVYAPSDIEERLKQVPAKGVLGAALPQGAALLQALAVELEAHNATWQKLEVDKVRPVLNPKAAWCGWAWPRADAPMSLSRVLELVQRDPQRADRIAALSSRGDQSQLLRELIEPHEDAGNLPPGIFPFFVKPESVLTGMGLLDDVSDGFIQAEVAGLKARARVVVTPPSVAPDRRAPVSIADGLADRVRREDGRDPDWVQGEHADITDAEMLDLFERAFETVGLQNADAMADFFRRENDNQVALAKLDLHASQHQQLENRVKTEFWKEDEQSRLPLTTAARGIHGALSGSIEGLKAFHGALEGKVREPDDGSRFYDKRMPGLMRGFDRRPMTLTRRQHELLAAWIARVKKETT